VHGQAANSLTVQPHGDFWQPEGSLRGGRHARREGGQFNSCSDALTMDRYSGAVPLQLIHPGLKTPGATRTTVQHHACLERPGTSPGKCRQTSYIIARQMWAA
jgi:hypothetical protein